jgi:hypothetical protein
MVHQFDLVPLSVYQTPEANYPQITQRGLCRNQTGYLLPPLRG